MIPPMSENDMTTAVSDVTRDFAYEEKPRLSPGWQLAFDIGETLVLTLVMFVVIRLAVQNYQIDGTSMVPTFQNSQFVLVDKLTYNFSAPQRGDVIVFEFPLNHSQNFIKRIIGIPGDRIEIDSGGNLSVNGETLTEPYINDFENAASGPKNVVLGPNQYFVMGDNRGGSYDSRDWGPVNRSEIIGKATLVYWPLNQLRLVPNEQGIFTHVPNAATPPSQTGATPTLGRVTADDAPFSAIALVGLAPLSGAIVGLQRRHRNKPQARQ
jgi:signal peptidase I